MNQQDTEDRIQDAVYRMQDTGGSGRNGACRRRAALVLPVVCLALVVGNLPAAETGSADFSVDWVTFRGTADSSRVEFFYAVPYTGLQDVFRAADSGLVAHFSMRFEMTGAAGFRQDATIYKQVRIDSFAEMVRTRRTFVDGFGVQVLPGEYRFRVTMAKPAQVQSDTTGEEIEYVESGSVEGDIEVPDLARGFVLSPPQLAAGVLYDSVSGGFSVIPNPTRFYGGPGLDRVYFYFEGYGLEAAPDSYEIAASVVGPGSDTVVTTGPIVKPKSGTRVSSVFGLSVEGLAPGEYSLVLELSDRGRKQSRAREAVFYVAGEPEEPGPATPYKMVFSEKEKRYYHQIERVATPRELGYYNSLSDSGKEAYLAWYWSRHNLPEFARRMDVADERYRTSRTPGTETDRGRVYVKYGEPDEVESMVLEVDRKPRQYWHYYGMGYVFIFIDLKGDGDFRLAYTSNPDEPRTGYELYLTEDERETFNVR